MSDSIESRFHEVMWRISDAAARSGRNADDISLVTVTKGFGIPSIIEAVEAGADILGENKAQELKEKYQVIRDSVSDRSVKWHFIGALQTNKVKFVVEPAALIHSVDRLGLAEEIDKRARAADKLQPVLIEVNVSGEAAKSGAAPAEALGLAKKLFDLPNLRVDGLMTMAPLAVDPEESRPYFAALRELRDRIAADASPGFRHLSMGMTGDFEVAVEEGATIVRVGRAIMGERPAGYGI